MTGRVSISQLLGLEREADRQEAVGALQQLILARARSAS